MRRRPMEAARLQQHHALVAQEAERVPGTDEVVGANPTEGPTEGIRPDEEPVCYAGTGRQPLWVRVPPLPLWKRSGWIRSLSRKQVGVARPLGVRVAPLPHSPRTRRSEAVLGERDGAAESTMPRWSRGQDTGPSTRRPGFDSPSRYSHTSTQMPEETKRSRARRAGRRSGVDSARWSSGKTSGCYPEGGGSNPSLAATTLGGRGVQARGCQSWR